ncbi:MAG TPA: DnaJ domain-containing protein [Polyangiaceae bacterium]|nr:DnaJ domain-containing protein [Polyangiaceae bacterium]
MESESGDAPGRGTEQPILFISDASAEAERLTLSLRARGHVVVDVPLALLPGRVAVQRPALVLCDADAENAVETVRRIRSIPADTPLSIVLVGERDGTIARLDVTLVEAVFARPVNVQELVGTVERLIGVDPSEIAPSIRSPKLSASSRPPARSNPSASPGPRITDRAGRPDPPAVASLPLPPDLAGDPAPRAESGDAPVVELSGDIQLMLLAAERRIEGDRSPSSSPGEEPGPEADVDAPLPPEVLVALEEPLDDDDDGAEKTGAPDRDGTGALTGPKTGSRGGTVAGTNATSLGTDAQGPQSESSFAQGAAPGPRTSVHAAPEQRFAEPPRSEPWEEEASSKKQRQQASTPKPPKPSGDDLKSTAPPEADRASVPPTTSVENLIPEPPSRRAVEGDFTSLRAPSRSGTLVEPRDLPPERGVFEREPPPPASTAPPRANDRAREPDAAPDTGRRAPEPRDDRGTDRPAPGEGGDLRRSELPPSRAPERTAEPPARRKSDRPSSPEAAPPAPPDFQVPAALRAGDATLTLARAIRSRLSGVLAFEVDEGIRRLVLRDGDFVTAASGVHAESLVAFLAARGDLAPEVARQAHKLPAFGRRAGAALIAHGHLAQDQLWPVLRAHAEWIIGRVVGIERGSVALEDLGRLHDEPAVFGGATGAEVLVEVVRRVVPPDEALERLGGPDVVLSQGPSRALLGECALSPVETERIQQAASSTIQTVVEGALDPSFSSVLYALVALGVLGVEGARPKPAPQGAKPPPRDEIDEDAFRARILSRKALVDEGDYFAVLGVSRDATGYDIRRAYAALRREFEPSRVLSPKNVDLGDVVTEILGVLEEAYEILSDQRRRDRYRRAIEATP